MTCPTCKKLVEKDGNKLFPFCCERCQMVDLGRWLNEEYRVPAEPTARQRRRRRLAQADDSFVAGVFASTRRSQVNGVQTRGAGESSETARRTAARVARIAAR